MKSTHQPATEREFMHPLRSLPWLRNLPDNVWVSLALTAVLCLTGAIVMTFAEPFPASSSGFRPRLRDNLIYGFAIGYSIQFLSEQCMPKVRAWLGDRAFIFRLLATMVVWACGTLLGFVIGGAVLGHGFPESVNAIFVVGIFSLLIAALTGMSLRRQAMRELQAEREKNERIEAQRALASTRLRLLQAQIEPHFLFNTLANVSSLIDLDAKRARVMLDQFTLLLRALLDQTRQSTTTLRKELQVAEAYLSVLKIRMGERLSYRIEVSPDLASKEVPAMLLQPIVENAVKHGIEPRMNGGMVCVAAHAEGNQLVLSVKDNGVGFVSNSTESIGLGAIRERLEVQFGDTAQLDISRTEDQWTQVAIRIPLPA